MNLYVKYIFFNKHIKAIINVKSFMKIRKSKGLNCETPSLIGRLPEMTLPSLTT